MIFRNHRPGPPLDGFVDGIIYHEGYQPGHAVDRFLPDGNVEIVIDLGDRPKHIYDNETLREIQTCRRVWASGVRTAPISIHSGKDSAMFVISFRKGMARPFFPAPMDATADSVVDADLLWKNSFELLRERLLATPLLAARFRLIEEFLRGMLAAGPEPNPCVGYAVDAILRDPGRTTIGELNRRIGYSPKHFISLFREQVGLTPKAYLRIIRFQRAVAAAENSREADWARISNDCGFYDQAHLIADFKRFSGFTPGEYVKRRNGILNYVPVG